MKIAVILDVPEYWPLQEVKDEIESHGLKVHDINYLADTTSADKQNKQERQTQQ